MSVSLGPNAKKISHKSLYEPLLELDFYVGFTFLFSLIRHDWGSH